MDFNEKVQAQLRIYPIKGMRDPLLFLGVHTIRAVRLPLNLTAKQYQTYEAKINI